MTTSKRVSELKINRMSKAQYNTITPLDTELYFVTDEADTLPDQEGQQGKFLTTDGTLPSWETVNALPNQEGESGKFLSTDGTIASWETVDALPDQEGQANKFLTTDGTIASWDTIPTQSRNIGEIVTSTIPLLDSGLHLLDGSLLQGNGIYTDFVNYIANLYNSGDYPNMFTTEANWQSSNSNYGICGKYVYDSTNNTVRLPKVTGILEGTTAFTQIGDRVAPGLPNILANVSNLVLQSTSTFFSYSGSFYNSNTGGASLCPASSTSVGTDVDNIGFDASRSNSIYGNSTTVQPQTIKVLYYVVIATIAKTDIQVDIDEIATDLNGKADTDLSNISSTGKNIIDGKWVSHSATITSGTSAPTSANLTYNLSSHLPNDEQTYEVLFSMYGQSSASSNVYTVGSLSSSLVPSTRVYTARAATGATVATMGGGNAIIPIGTDRKVYVDYVTSNTGTFTLIMRAYRRLGTNN